MVNEGKLFRLPRKADFEVTAVSANGLNMNTALLVAGCKFEAFLICENQKCSVLDRMYTFARWDLVVEVPGLVGFSDCGMLPVTACI